jgi:hypothetical protein
MLIGCQHNHIVSLSQNSFFFTLRTLAISLERTGEEKNKWKQLVHGEEEPRNDFEEQLSVSYCKRIL